MHRLHAGCAAGQLPPTVWEAHIADIVLTIRVDGSGLTVTRGAAAAPDLRFAAGPGIRHIISGELSPDAAIAESVVHVLDGDPALLDSFARTFHLKPKPVATVG